MEVITDNLDLYWSGLGTTVLLSVLAFGLALAVGTTVATFRVSPVNPLRVLGASYVEVFRNVPLTVQFVLFYFGLPKAGVIYPPFTSAVIVMTLYTGAFLAETIRSGINSVPAGQTEAARSLGLGFLPTVFSIVLPQAFRTVVAPIGGNFIAHIKNTSIASIIAVADLMNVGDRLASETALPVAAFIGVGVGYLLLTYPCGLLVGLLERRVAIRR